MSKKHVILYFTAGAFIHPLEKEFGTEHRVKFRNNRFPLEEDCDFVCGHVPESFQDQEVYPEAEKEGFVTPAGGTLPALEHMGPSDGRQEPSGSSFQDIVAGIPDFNPETPTAENIRAVKGRENLITVAEFYEVELTPDDLKNMDNIRAAILDDLEL